MGVDYWQSVVQGKINGIALSDLAKRYGTPLYIYHYEAIIEALSAYRTEDFHPKIHYAVKANSNLSILKLLREQGLGFDIVSQGELERVLKIGGNPADIIFSGIGKTDEEIKRALEVGVGCLNIESESELYRISKIAKELDLEARIAFRVNPNVNPKTHPYISTGMKDNKFGVPIEKATGLYKKASSMDNLKIRGISCHIGSQITNFSSFYEAFQSLLDLAEVLEKENIKLEFIDIGGGVGVQSQDNESVPKASILIEKMYEMLGNRNYEIHMQPGRSIIANAGFLLTKTLANKKQSEKEFIITDAAMNDYIRPALYSAYPAVKNVTANDTLSDKKKSVVDIVGPVCESGDFFIKSIEFSAEVGDILAFAGVGAYGMSMSSQYNSRLRAAEILIKDDCDVQIRKRETYEQLWENEL